MITCLYDTSAHQLLYRCLDFLDVYVRCTANKSMNIAKCPPAVIDIFCDMVQRQRSRLLFSFAFRRKGNLEVHILAEGALWHGEKLYSIFLVRYHRLFVHNPGTR